MVGLNDKKPNDNRDNSLSHRNKHQTDDVVPKMPREQKTAPDHPQKDTNIDATEKYLAGMEEAAETKKPDYVDGQVDDQADPLA